MRLTSLRVAFVLLVTSGVLIPVVPVFGPLSTDDLLPLAAILCTAIGFTSSQTTRPVLDATLWGFGLLMLASIISSASNGDSLTAFGAMLVPSLGRNAFYLSLIIGGRLLLQEAAWARGALFAFVGVGTIEAIFSVFSLATGYSGPYGIGAVPFRDWSALQGLTRIQGTFGGTQTVAGVMVYNPNFLAAYMVMSICVTCGVLLFSRTLKVRLLLGASLVLQIITLYATFTRAGLVALAIAMLAFGWLLGKKKLTVLVITVGIVGSLMIPPIRVKFLHEKHDRLTLYSAAAHVAKDFAATGVGEGRYLKLIHEDSFYARTPFGPATSTPHNSILLSSVSHGVLGGLARVVLYVLLLLIGFSAVRFSDRRTRYLTTAITSGLVGFLVQDQSNNLAHVPVVATQMWFLFLLLPLLADPAKHADTNPVETLPRGDVDRDNENPSQNVRKNANEANTAIASIASPSERGPR